MPRRNHLAEDPAAIYKLFSHNGDHDALAKTLAYVLGTETEDPETIVAAVHAAVLRATIPGGELEELRTQIRLCNLAALTGADVTDIPRSDPGWSEAYENTKVLYARYRAISELYEKLPWPVITAYEFWESVKKEITGR